MLYRTTLHPTTALVQRALAVIAVDAADLLTSSDAARLAARASPPCNRFLLKRGRRQGTRNRRSRVGLCGVPRGFRVGP